MFSDGNLFALLDPATAIFAGLVASLHCVGMCGPLSCALIGKAKSGSMLGSHGFYHAGRVIAYAGLGALAGALGGSIVSWLGETPTKFAPWALAAFFVALAFNFDGLFTRWQARRGFGRGIVQKAYRLSGHRRGLALGLATPLIPCGPLYLMLWATTMSGSAANGAVVMAAFAAGTVPLMLLAQSGWTWLSARARPERLAYLRRGLALVAVGLICMRAFLDMGPEALIAGDALCH